MIPLPFTGDARLVRTLLLLLFLSAVPTTLAQIKDWRPVTPAELQMKTGQVEPDADAEAIFWETWIDKRSVPEFPRYFYVRIKILTERGREKYSKFDIPYTQGATISDLSARVIKTDGSTVEIKKGDVIDREIIKANGAKLRSKSFAMPNTEPGVIVEYKYKEVRNFASALGGNFQFQQDIPIQKSTFYIKTYNGKAPSVQSYNLPNTKFEKGTDGFYAATLNNVPAFHGEPQMPPENAVRPWMMFTGSAMGQMILGSFTTSAIKDPANISEYWNAVSAVNVRYVDFMNKPDDDIKTLAQRLTAGASSDDEKLRRLYEYCQTEIHNRDLDTSLPEEKRKLPPEIRSLGDVLK